jgi:hypothetical protein
MGKVKHIVINNYKKYWVSDTAQGHLIKICHGDKDQVTEIDLRWKIENEILITELITLKLKIIRNEKITRKNKNSKQSRM